MKKGARTCKDYAKNVATGTVTFWISGFRTNNIIHNTQNHNTHVFAMKAVKWKNCENIQGSHRSNNLEVLKNGTVRVP